MKYRDDTMYIVRYNIDVDRNDKITVYGGKEMKELNQAISIVKMTHPNYNVAFNPKRGYGVDLGKIDQKQITYYPSLRELYNSDEMKWVVLDSILCEIENGNNVLETYPKTYVEKVYGNIEKNTFIHDEDAMNDLYILSAMQFLDKYKDWYNGISYYCTIYLLQELAEKHISRKEGIFKSILSFIKKS